MEQARESRHLLQAGNKLGARRIVYNVESPTKQFLLLQWSKLSPQKEWKRISSCKDRVYFHIWVLFNTQALPRGPNPVTNDTD